MSARGALRKGGSPDLVWSPQFTHVKTEAQRDSHLPKDTQCQGEMPELPSQCRALSIIPVVLKLEPAAEAPGEGLFRHRFWAPPPEFLILRFAFLISSQEMLLV